MLENISARELAQPFGRRIAPGTFDLSRHVYGRVLEARAHPEVKAFFGMGSDEMVRRYCRTRPDADAAFLLDLMHQTPAKFRWAGCDLFQLAGNGPRRMVVVETNSCPSGNKSLPALHHEPDQRGYRTLMTECFLPLLEQTGLPAGDLAVVYDKNPMECGGYAAALADATGESVWLAPFPEHGDPPVRFVAGVLEVRDEGGKWHPIRAAFRYVTQRPWTRIPVVTKTAILNPVVACLAGGRNKLVAAKAYQQANLELAKHGLAVQTVDTVVDVKKGDIAGLVEEFGGRAVIKIPYGNAGQGVFTIVNPRELKTFLDTDWGYQQFIVQRLVGEPSAGGVHHVGTVPDETGSIFAFDLRLMICATPRGFRPLAMYARRARQPLQSVATAEASWDVFGTNLSDKKADGGWQTDPDRLILADTEDFHRLGLSLDNLIEACVQTVMATVAIDRVAEDLTAAKSGFDLAKLQALNQDETFLHEIRIES